MAGGKMTMRIRPAKAQGPEEIRAVAALSPRVSFEVRLHFSEPRAEAFDCGRDALVRLVISMPPWIRSRIYAATGPWCCW